MTRAGLDLDALEALARDVAERCAPVAALWPVTIGLRGGLGAGKTTFTRAFVGALEGGGTVRVTSPTYAILHCYPTRPEVRHADLYRLEGESDLDAIGFAEAVEEPGFNLVEWIDRVPAALPPESVEITLAASGEDVRDVRVIARGAALAPLFEETQ